MRRTTSILDEKRALLFIGLFFIFSLILTPACKKADSERSAFSQPQPVRLPGLTNTYRVSAVLYRGAQPEPEGFRKLKKLGIRTVINLRGGSGDKIEAEQSGLAYIQIPMSPFFPSRRKFGRLLDILSDPKHFPVFIHCKRGADRTGAAVALYRIYFQGWEYSEAMDEMTKGPYGFHSIHNNLKSFVRRLPWRPSTLSKFPG